MPKRGPRSAEAAERRLSRGVKRRSETAGSSAPPPVRAAGSSAPAGVEVAGSSAPHPGAQVAGSSALSATVVENNAKKEVDELKVKEESEKVKPKGSDTRILTKAELAELIFEI